MSEEKKAQEQEPVVPGKLEGSVQPPGGGAADPGAPEAQVTAPAPRKSGFILKGKNARVAAVAAGMAACFLGGFAVRAVTTPPPPAPEPIVKTVTKTERVEVFSPADLTDEELALKWHSLSDKQKAMYIGVFDYMDEFSPSSMRTIMTSQGLSEVEADMVIARLSLISNPKWHALTVAGKLCLAPKKGEKPVETEGGLRLALLAHFFTAEQADFAAREFFAPGQTS